MIAPIVSMPDIPQSHLVQWEADLVDPLPVEHPGYIVVIDRLTRIQWRVSIKGHSLSECATS